MIKSWRDHDAENLFRTRESSKRLRGIDDACYRKLVQLDEAGELRDLAAIPGNRLEKLSGRRKGQYSIHVNDQWRVCFRWEEGNAYEVEIADYH